MTGHALRELRIERGLNPVNPIEAVIIERPSLAMRTVATVLGADRQTTVMLFQGDPEDLDEITTRYVEAPPAEIESIHILERAPRMLLVHEVETSGVNPADISDLVLRTLGPETIVRIRKDAQGVQWNLLPFHQGRLPDFLAGLKAAGPRVAAAANDVSWYRLSRIARFGTDHQVLDEREQSVLQAAVQLGYYEVPKACHLDELANEVRLPRSTAHHVLKRAERKTLVQGSGWLP